MQQGFKYHSLLFFFVLLLSYLSNYQFWIFSLKRIQTLKFSKFPQNKLLTHLKEVFTHNATVTSHRVQKNKQNNWKWSFIAQNNQICQELCVCCLQSVKQRLAMFSSTTAGPTVPSWSLHRIHFSHYFTKSMTIAIRATELDSLGDAKGSQKKPTIRQDNSINSQYLNKPVSQKTLPAHEKCQKKLICMRFPWPSSTHSLNGFGYR